MEEQKKGTRRRGALLEEAILNAAINELDRAGYAHLTMEKVAERAGTNKAVLYRRWANKAELVIAALHKHLPKIPDEIPDTGNLRDDVFAYLHARIEPFKAIGVQTIRGLMMEPVIWSHIAAIMPHIAQHGSEDKLTAAMMGIMKNAEKRGEVRLEKLLPRVICLPIDLLKYDLITKQEVSDAVIAEIVDDIFMPLVELKKE